MDREMELTKFMADAFLRFARAYGFDPAEFFMDVFSLRDISKRYYKDVDRLCAYHSMSRIDAYKAAGYIAYWITKIRPVAVVSPKMYKNYAEMSLYINEIFALHIATGRLLLLNDIKNVRLNKNFLSPLLYLLKYRLTTGDNLALMFYFMGNQF